MGASIENLVLSASLRFSSAVVVASIAALAAFSPAFAEEVSRGPVPDAEASFAVIDSEAPVDEEKTLPSKGCDEVVGASAQGGSSASGNDELETVSSTLPQREDAVEERGAAVDLDPAPNSDPDRVAVPSRASREADGLRSFEAREVPRSGWVRDRGAWRYFDPFTGSVRTGLFRPEGSKLWFHAGSDGVISSGWIDLDGDRHYANPDGDLVSGFRLIEGSWYYFDSSVDGSPLVRGKEFEASKARRYADANGVVKHGGWAGSATQRWSDKAGCLVGPESFVSGGKRYIRKQDGSALTGWVKLSGSVFYADSSQGGALATGKRTIGASSYIFEPSTGEVRSGWIDWKGERYLALASGRLLTGWQNDRGAWYCFDEQGRMRRGWVYGPDGQTCYLDDKTGVRLSGLREVRGKLYYFDPSAGDGVVRDTMLIIGGCAYRFNVYGEATRSDVLFAQRARWMSSSTGWLVLVDTRDNQVAVYQGSKGNWNLVRFVRCTSGAPSTPTVKGTFRIGAKGYVFGHGYSCYYYSQFYGDYLFHSVLYYPNGGIMDGRLGINASHGCVRLAIEDAKFIYDCVPSGTTVRVW